MSVVAVHRPLWGRSPGCHGAAALCTAWTRQCCLADALATTPLTSCPGVAAMLCPCPSLPAS